MFSASVNLLTVSLSRFRDDARRPPLGTFEGHPLQDALYLQQRNMLQTMPFGGLSFPSIGYPQSVPSFPAAPAAPPSNLRPPDVGGGVPTLYVTNLPKDVTEREMSILFRFMPNFLGVRLITKEGKSPICFVDFVDAASAAVAMHLLQDFRIDLRDDREIHIEYDRGTSKERRRG